MVSFYNGLRFVCDGSQPVRPDVRALSPPAGIDLLTHVRMPASRIGSAPKVIGVFIPFDAARPAQAEIKLILDKHAVCFPKQTGAWIDIQVGGCILFVLMHKDLSWLNLEGCFSEMTRFVICDISVASAGALKARVVVCFE